MRRGIAEASRACCRAVAERRLRGRVSEASQGNRRGGAKARAVVRAKRRRRGAVVEASRGHMRGQASQSRRVEASQRRRSTSFISGTNMNMT